MSFRENIHAIEIGHPQTDSGETHLLLNFHIKLPEAKWLQKSSFRVWHLFFSIVFLSIELPKCWLIFFSIELVLISFSFFPITLCCSSLSLSYFLMSSSRRLANESYSNQRPNSMNKSTSGQCYGQSKGKNKRIFLRQEELCTTGQIDRTRSWAFQ